MEQRTLPNVTIALVLGVMSFICCCFSMGIGGIVLSGIALFLVRKDEASYAENPDEYNNYGQLKTAKTIAIIGLVLGFFALLMVLYNVYSIGGWDEMLERQQEMYEQWGIEV